MTGGHGPMHRHHRRWPKGARPGSLFDLMTLLASAFDPTVRAAKVGTPHEGHDGWGIYGDTPGVYRCGCGESIDGIVRAFVDRLADD